MYTTIPQSEIRIPQSEILKPQSTFRNSKAAILNFIPFLHNLSKNYQFLYILSPFSQR